MGDYATPVLQRSDKPVLHRSVESTVANIAFRSFGQNLRFLIIAQASMDARPLNRNNWFSVSKVLEGRAQVKRYAIILLC